MNKIAQMCINSDDNNTAYLIPILQVHQDDNTCDVVENVKTEDDGKSTAVFSRKPQQAYEITSEVKPTICDKISRFFKKLFEDAVRNE